LPMTEAQGSGAIINLGALGGVRWTGYAYCAYAASKGAVNSFTQSVAWRCNMQPKAFAPTASCPA